MYNDGLDSPKREIFLSQSEEIRSYLEDDVIGAGGAPVLHLDQAQRAQLEKVHGGGSRRGQCQALRHDCQLPRYNFINNERRFFHF